MEKQMPRVHTSSDTLTQKSKRPLIDHKYIFGKISSSSANWFKENKSVPNSEQSEESHSHNFNLTGNLPVHQGELSSSSISSSNSASDSSSSSNKGLKQMNFDWQPLSSSPELNVQNKPVKDAANLANEATKITVPELLVQLMEGGTYTRSGVLYMVQRNKEEQYMLLNITGQFSQVLVTQSVAHVLHVRDENLPGFSTQATQTDIDVQFLRQSQKTESRESAALTESLLNLNYANSEQESMSSPADSRINMKQPIRLESTKQLRSNLDVEMLKPKYWTDGKQEEELSVVSSKVSTPNNRRKSVRVNVSVQNASSQRSSSQLVTNKGMRTIIEEAEDILTTPVQERSEKRALSGSRRQETKIEAEQVKLDIATIEQLFNETEAEEKAEKSTKKRADSSISTSSARKGESYENFSVAAMSQNEYSFRRSGTNVSSPIVSKESYHKLLSDFKNMQEQLRLANSFKKAQLHIGFLFASPFCHIVNAPAGRNNYLIYPQLQFITEAKHIKAGAKQSNGISYKCAVATQTNFVQMLSKAPKIVHISCHGIPNSKSCQMGHGHEDGDYLLFEHEQFIGELLSEKSLKNLVSNVDRTELVFLAACDSEFAARIFIRKGARHVICIEDMKEVLDKAVLTFTDTFYRAVFEGNSICDSFTVAQKLTTNLHTWNEAKIFKLLTSENKHECLPVQFDQSKCFENQSDKIIVKEIPAKVEHLVFREKEMSKLIQKIMEGQRLVFVFGLLGIGKSVIARNVLHFMKERKYFCGGIINVSLNGMKSIETFCHSLCQILVKNLVTTETDRPFFEGLMDSRDQQINFIVNFFNLTTEFKLKKVEKHLDRNLLLNERSKKFLVCLDNAEDLIEVKREEFKTVLKRLLNSCPYLQIIITSRRHLLKLDDECIDPDPLFIPQLKGTKPVELFLLKAEKHRSITTEEIVDLIQMDKGFNLEAFSGGQFKNLQAPEANTKLKLLLRQRNKVIEALLKHDLFHQFAGNPLSISTLAACYANPMAKKKELKFLYKKMLEGQLDLRLEEDDRTSQGGSNNDKPTGKGNSISLQLALQSSVDLLSEQSREAESLLYFLSLLPTGIQLAQLTMMWTGQVEPLIKIIQLYEFLDGGFNEKYVVLPFVRDFLKESINNTDKDNFINKICMYYGSLLARLYRVISVDSGITSSQISPPEERKPSFADRVNAQNRRNSVTFELFLKQQLQHSTGVDKPVLSESLDQIVNIENCLDHLMHMLVEPNSDSDTDSIKTEIFSDSEAQTSQKSQDDNVTRKQPQVMIESSDWVDAVRFLPNRSISLEKLSRIIETDEEQKSSGSSKFKITLKPTNRKTNPVVPVDRITITKMNSLSDKSSDSASPKKQVRKLQSNTSAHKFSIRQEVSDSSGSDSYSLGTMEDLAINQYTESSAANPKGSLGHHSSDLVVTRDDQSSQPAYVHSNSCRLTKNVVVEVQKEPEHKRLSTRRDAQSLQRGNSISKYQQKIGKLERQNVMVGLNKKRSLMGVTSSDEQSHEMSQSGFTASECFVTYAVAVMFLSQEYNFSLSICNSSFKTKFSSPIFKANILRFKALNLEHLAIKEPKSEASTDIQGTENPRGKMLANALICAKKALKLYKGAKETCEYGVGLSFFQIGHLLLEYHSEISTDHHLTKRGNLIHHEPLKLGTEDYGHQFSEPLSPESPQTMLRAEDYYKYAIASFLEIGHAKGVEIAKEALKRMAPSEKKYHVQLKHNNTSPSENKTGFLLRKQGENISLMTEIVTKEKYKSLQKQQDILGKSKTIQAQRRDTETSFNPHYSLIDEMGNSSVSELSYEPLDQDNK